jgi:hypothetical protein
MKLESGIPISHNDYLTALVVISSDYYKFEVIDGKSVKS